MPQATLSNGSEKAASLYAWEWHVHVRVVPVRGASARVRAWYQHMHGVSARHVCAVAPISLYCPQGLVVLDAFRILCT